jgi:hypothetical protein
MKTAIQRSIASLLIVSVTSLGIPPAKAGTVSTEETTAAKRDRVAAMLERADVRAALEARGVSPADARGRVAALTDREVAELAKGVDTHPAGAGGGVESFLWMLFLLPIIAVVVVVGLINAGGRSSRSSEEPQGTPADDASPFPIQG